MFVILLSISQTNLLVIFDNGDQEVEVQGEELPLFSFALAMDADDLGASFDEDVKWNHLRSRADINKYFSNSESSWVRDIQIQYNKTL